MRPTQAGLALLLHSGILLAPLGAQTAAHPEPGPRVLVLHPAGLPTDDPALQGVELGMEETRRTAALLGRRFQVELEPVGPGAAPILKPGTVIVLSLLPAEDLARVLSATPPGGPLVLNLTSPASRLRDARCHALLFHLTPDNPGTGGSPEGGIVAWTPDLFRYGATQLNDRYRRRFARGMTGPAWTGWFAAKVAWEALARSGATSGPELRRFLEDPATGFDGHKGEILSFDPEVHQLRQPLYQVGPSGTTELPADSALTGEPGSLDSCSSEVS